MRRLIVSLFVLCVSVALPRVADAQVMRVFESKKATITNTDTTVINCAVEDASKSLQLVVTRISGTAAGKAFILVSNDGINYLPPPGLDTITFTNAARNVKLWTIAPLNYSSYQVKVISSGTTSLSARAFVSLRKQ